MNTRSIRTTAVMSAAAILMLLVGAPASAQVADDGPSEKSPVVALGLSLVFPGAGQAYNGQWAKAGVVFGGVVLTSGAILFTIADVFELDDDRSSTGVHIAGAAGMALLVWSWVDAPLSASRINRSIRAGDLALEAGPRLGVDARHGRLDLSLMRLRF